MGALSCHHGPALAVLVVATRLSATAGAIHDQAAPPSPETTLPQTPSWIPDNPGHARAGGDRRRDSGTVCGVQRRADGRDERRRLGRSASRRRSWRVPPRRRWRGRWRPTGWRRRRGRCRTRLGGNARRRGAGRLRPWRRRRSRRRRWRRGRSGLAARSPSPFAVGTEDGGGIEEDLTEAQQEFAGVHAVEEAVIEAQHDR